MVTIYSKPTFYTSFFQNYCLKQLFILLNFKKIVKVLQVFLACIFIFSCTPKHTYKFYKADALMYVEYIGYLKLLEKGEKAVIAKKN